MMGPGPDFPEVVSTSISRGCHTTHQLCSTPLADVAWTQVSSLHLLSLEQTPVQEYLLRLALAYLSPTLIKIVNLLTPFQEDSWWWNININYLMLLTARSWNELSQVYRRTDNKLLSRHWHLFCFLVLSYSSIQSVRNIGVIIYIQKSKCQIWEETRRKGLESGKHWLLPRPW